MKNGRQVTTILAEFKTSSSAAANLCTTPSDYAFASSLRSGSSTSVSAKSWAASPSAWPSCWPNASASCRDFEARHLERLRPLSTAQGHRKPAARLGLAGIEVAHDGNERELGQLAAKPQVQQRPEL